MFEMIRVFPFLSFIKIKEKIDRNMGIVSYAYLFYDFDTTLFLTHLILSPRDDIVEHKKKE